MPKTLPNERVSTKCMLIRLESGSLMKIKWETVCVCHVPHGRSHLHSAVINTELNRNPTPCSHIFLCGFFFTLDSPSPTPCCVFSIFCEAVKGSEVGDGQSASCHGHTKKEQIQNQFSIIQVNVFGGSFVSRWEGWFSLGWVYFTWMSKKRPRWPWVMKSQISSISATNFSWQDLNI